jgi:hypothetical protein
MNGVAVTPLTVSFHEGMFLNKANSENKAPFWFQMDGDAKQQHGSPMGPANPQALNRYSYVQNNPLKYTDPTGHASCDSGAGCGGVVQNDTDESIWIVGSVMGACPDGSGNGVICENVLVEIPAGSSSIDAGVADADAVITQFNADGSVEGYKLTNSELATIAKDDNGNIVLFFEAKSPWLQPIVGIERVGRGITNIDSRKSTWRYEFVQNAKGELSSAKE